MEPERFEQILADSPENIQKAYDTMLNPPEFELYDLKKDPHEWNNLSENPQYGHIIARLKKELHEWQVEDVVK